MLTYYPSTRGQTGSRFGNPKDALFVHALTLGLVRGLIFANHKILRKAEDFVGGY